MLVIQLLLNVVTKYENIAFLQKISKPSYHFLIKEIFLR